MRERISFLRMFRACPRNSFGIPGSLDGCGIGVGCPGVGDPSAFLGTCGNIMGPVWVFGPFGSSELCASPSGTRSRRDIDRVVEFVGQESVLLFGTVTFRDPNQGRPLGPLSVGNMAWREAEIAVRHRTSSFAQGSSTWVGAADCIAALWLCRVAP